MAGAYTITIQAVDNASAGLDAVNARVAALNKQIALARAPFDRLQQSFQRFAKTTGLDRIGAGFKEVAENTSETFRNMLKVIEPLSWITGAASVEGLYRLATAWGEFGTQLGILSARSGMTADALQTLQNAARISNVSAGALTSGVIAMNDNMRNAAFGGAPQFMQAIQALGLNYDELKKKTPTELVEVFADAIAKIKSPTDQAIVATRLFGEAGQAMLPMLRESGEGIRKAAEEAKHLGRNLGTEGANAANDFSTAQTRLAIASEGLARALGEKVGVALTPLLNQFAEWIATSPDVEKAITATGQAAEQFATWIKAVNWHAVGEEIDTIARHVNAVAQYFGGWEKAGEDLIIFFTGRFLVQMLAPFAKIGAALVAVPVQAALSVAKANASLGPLVGLVGRLGGMLGSLGVLAALWEGTNKLDDATATQADGLQNLLHNMLFDMNPAHWTRSYHPGQDAQPDLNRPAVPLKPGEQQDNAKAIAGVLAADGVTREGQAALLGSGLVESGLNPSVTNASGHTGIFQTSQARQQVIEARFHKPYASMTAAEEARAALWEIDNQPQYAAVRSAIHGHDLVAANKAVTDTFEAPANAGTPELANEESNRLARSKGALAMLPDSAAPAAAPTPSGEPVNAPAPLAGSPGANGRVDMNVKVDGAAQVTTTTTGDIGMKVENRNVAKDGY